MKVSSCVSTDLYLRSPGHAATFALPPAEAAGMLQETAVDRPTSTVLRKIDKNATTRTATSLTASAMQEERTRRRTNAPNVLPLDPPPSIGFRPRPSPRPNHHGQAIGSGAPTQEMAKDNLTTTTEEGRIGDPAHQDFLPARACTEREGKKWRGSPHNVTTDGDCDITMRPHHGDDTADGQDSDAMDWDGDADEDGGEDADGSGSDGDGHGSDGGNGSDGRSSDSHPPPFPAPPPRLPHPTREEQHGGQDKGRGHKERGKEHAGGNHEGQERRPMSPEQISIGPTGKNEHTADGRANGGWNGGWNGRKRNGGRQPRPQCGGRDVEITNEDLGNASRPHHSPSPRQFRNSDDDHECERKSASRTRHDLSQSSCSRKHLVCDVSNLNGSSGRATKDVWNTHPSRDIGQRSASGQPAAHAELHGLRPPGLRRRGDPRRDRARDDGQNGHNYKVIPIDYCEHVTIYIASHHSLLDLRGGGPCARSARRPPLGAGVLQWLEDSDYEADEAAELARRLNEEAIFSGQSPSQAATCGPHPPAPGRPPPLITGQNAGESVIVCMECYRDSRPDSIAGNRTCCGTVVCLHCAVRTCERCHQRAGHSSVTISLARSIDQHQTIIATSAIDSPPSCRALDERAETDWSNGLANDEGGDRTEPRLGFMPTAIGMQEEGLVERRHDLRDDDDGTQCASCGVSAALGITQWRICRCTATYCPQCAALPCVDCPAMFAWRGDDLPEQYVTSVTTSDNATAAASPTYYSAPTTFTPEEAATRRTRLMTERTEERDRQKSQYRERRRRQIQEGLRPKREKPQRRPVLFGTVNVTDASTWRRELENGQALHSIDYLMVQEHGQFGDDHVEATTKWLRRCGCDPIVDSAYIKRTEPGGGTAVVSRAGGGLRRLKNEETRAAEGAMAGRFSVGVGNAGIDITVASAYLISGADIAHQLDLLSGIAMAVKRIGLPCVIGGDWQLAPGILKSSGLLDVLDAIICAPDGATNAVSGNTIDYFIVSRALVDHGWRVEVRHDCMFSPHRLVTLELNLQRARAPSQRLARPKPYPPDIPHGPHPVGIVINWGEYDASKGVDQNLAQWYAAVDCEIASLHGIANTAEEIAHMGTGMAPRMVRDSSGGRYQHAPDDMGLIGHRLTWAARGLALWIRVSHRLKEGRAALELIDTLWRTGHRAGAYWQEEKRRAPNDDLTRLREPLKRALCHMATWSRTTRHKPPCIARYLNGDEHSRGRMDLLIFQLSDEVDDAIDALRRERHARDLKAVRTWCRTATMRMAHRATKIPESPIGYSASANKSHRGERTPQLAADAGANEWGKLWRAEDDSGPDDSDHILSLLENVDGDVAEPTCSVLTLPAIDADSVEMAARTFRGDTGVGVDWLPPRLVSRTSKGARQRLSDILTSIEADRRWPRGVRAVIELARAKKSGGARLIGLAPSLYRIWSRIRYLHVRAQLERRIARPFLAAAPGRGAQRAVQDAAWRCELAASRGEHAAATTVDLKQYYEQITVAEIVKGARTYGIPDAIVLLAADLYLGPRCIKVGACFSRFIRPRRSILAGCTWAMVFIRLIMIRPTEKLLSTLRHQAASWGAKVDLDLYVDDGILVTSGHLAAVSTLHEWACRILLRWIRWVIRKETAEGKLHCIASSPQLRQRLATGLRDEGFQVNGYGELLGVGFAAGARIRKRSTNASRLRQALRRRGRLKWLRQHGGRAHRVMKEGIRPAVNYEAPVTGIDDRTMRTIRRAQGTTCRVRCGGASLTARLAIGGEKFTEADPWVLDNPAPIISVLSRVWDEPRRRSELVVMWRKVRAEMADMDPRRKWRSVRGMVGACLLHLQRIGGDWPKPFVIQLLGHEVDILSTPPKQVAMIIRRQARQHLDTVHLRRLAADNGWNPDAILSRYPYGIDWETVRGVLRGAAGNLTKEERWAYEVLVCGAFWTEERRWHAGYAPHGSCSACTWEIGNQEHKIIGCGAMAAHIAGQRASGRLGPTTDSIPEGLQPLHLFGLPPLTSQIAPQEVEMQEGDMGRDWEGDTYGDGSGYYQDSAEHRLATWAIIRLRTVAGRNVECQRGNVPGWLSTVPRGEMLAYIGHLKSMGPRGTYIGDCAMVIRAARMGVMPQATTSSNINADLWKRIKELQDDVGLEGAVARKTKAHRSRRAAEMSADDPVEQWEGNQLADSMAKDLARRTAEEANGYATAAAGRTAAIDPIRRAAIAVAWNLRLWPSLGLSKSKKQRRMIKARPEDMKGHLLAARGPAAWECTRCRLWARGMQGRRAILRDHCKGPIEAQAHPTHRTRQDGGVVWCTRCGAYASRLARNLLRPCVGRPSTEAQRNVWRRLQRGMAPTTAAYLADDRTLNRQQGRPQPDEDLETHIAANRARARSRREHAALGLDHIGYSGKYLRLPGGPLHRDEHLGENSAATQPMPQNGTAQTLAPPTETAAPVTASPPSSSCLSATPTRTSAATQTRRRLSTKTPPPSSPTNLTEDDVPMTDTDGIGITGTSRVCSALATSAPSTSSNDRGGVSPEARSGAEPALFSSTRQTPSICTPGAADPWTRRISSAGTPVPTIASACSICGAPCRTTCRGCRRRVCTHCAMMRRQCIVTSPVQMSHS